MLNITANYPIFIKQNKKFDLLLGTDYTTSNKNVPSGLAPQVTFNYFIVDNSLKDYMIYVGLTKGYLFDFNKDFENQFRITPHIYFEYMGLLNIKTGYDYLFPLKKGYPFISVGLGGLYMNKNLKIM